MGIPGIYKEIGHGERLALSQIAVQHLEKTGRPLRLAIDISIWQFQIQSGQGGKNPALRTLYYRLLRLLALSIQPLFVFDGPEKPRFKRGRKIAPGAACLQNYQTKELLKHFGFPHHTAPGEAEAECALLQKENVVDAVLSEDVDTMMFGCSMTMRTWTAEGTRGNKSPTHVNVYMAESTRKDTGLDSEGMILVALMSGGDYLPEGIVGCGPKIACEAAKAGFGRDMCQISENDTDGMIQWRHRLERELQTNESKFFRQKHKAMKIPDTFPDMAVLGYYTHPAISSREKVAKIRDEIKWRVEINLEELRKFVADAFDWQYLSGAKKFIRGLAPALLAYQLVRRSQTMSSDDENLEAKERTESKLVKSICGRRNHWNTGGEPELRIAYIPLDIVGLDLESKDKDDIQENGLNASEDEQLASEVDENRGRSKSPTKRQGPSTYDPAQVEKIWILETHVKLGAPLLVETWEEEMRDPKKFASRKAREKAKTATSKASIESGALDQYVKLTKPRSDDHASKPPVKGNESKELPPAYLAPTLVDISAIQRQEILAQNLRPIGQKAHKPKPPVEAKAKRTRKAPLATSATQPSLPSKDRTTNPWTLAKRTPEKPRFRSQPRLLSPSPPPNLSPPSPIQQEPTPHPVPSPSPKNLHPRPSTPISDTEPPLLPLDKNITVRKKPTDPTKPSPRKKRSPLQRANELFLAGQLRTPDPTPTKHKGVILVEEGLTSEQRKVNRKLDFTPTGQVTPPRTSPTREETGELPEIEALVALGGGLGRVVEGKMEGESSTVKGVGGGRIVALRESLEGAWKVLEPWEVGSAVRLDELCEGRRGRRVFGCVEVVDLTGG